MKKLFAFLFTILMMVLLSACSGGSTPQPSASPTTEIATLQAALPTHAPTSTASQLSTAPGDVTPDPLLDLPYTEEEPLTDPEEILQILDELQRRELAWFSRPGWLQFTETSPQTDHTKIRHLWTHVINDALDCQEQFIYFEHEDEILPYTIRLENGVTGTNHPVLGGKLSQDFFYETSPACTLTSSWILTYSEGYADDFIIHDEAAEFRSFLRRSIPGNEDQFFAWVRKIESRPTLVLVFDVKIGNPALRGSVLDQTTGSLASVARNIVYKYIDLETGLAARFTEEFYNEDGRLLSESHFDEKGGYWYFYHWYETLPASIAQVYYEMEYELKEYMKIREKE